jgi:predicted outer membrane repeat protein
VTAGGASGYYSGEAAAAVFADISSDVTIINCTISKNSLKSAVFITGKAAFQNNRFIGNVAVKRGTALSLNAPQLVRVEDCVFEDNISADGGSAIYGSNVIVERCSFLRNLSLVNGGAVYIGPSATFIVKDSIFQQNAARFGGAIALMRNSACTVTGSSFVSNQASDEGGAILGSPSTNITTQNCTFASNVANYGGGISVFYNSVLSVVDSSFNDHTVKSLGGAVNGGDSTSISILYTRFLGNAG